MMPTRLSTETENAWEAISRASKFSSPSCAVLVGDAAEQLAKLPSGSAHTCLTSPPYWKARDYEDKRQLGLEPDPEKYVSRICEVFREVARVLLPTGTAWLNLGDSYINGAAGDPGSWRRSKQLSLIPYRLAIALQEDGWLVRNAVAWHKPNAMPASVRDRLSNTWEPMFLLARQDNYYFDLDSIRVPHKTDDQIERRRAESGRVNGKAKGKTQLRRWLNSPRHRATIDGLKEVRRRPIAPDPTVLAAYLRKASEAKGVTIGWVAQKLKQPFERVRHYFRTDQIGSRLPPEDTWLELKKLLDLDDQFDEAMGVEVGDNVFRNHPKGRNPGDFQSIAVNGADIGHFAVMPDSLALWALRATLPTGGTCLDPFAGSGTTGRAALELGGRFVGIDLRLDFAKHMYRSLRESAQLRLMA